MSKAYVFPGQGAQSVGMGKDLYESNARLRNCSTRRARFLAIV